MKLLILSLLSLSFYSWGTEVCVGQLITNNDWTTQYFLSCENSNPEFTQKSFLFKKDKDFRKKVNDKVTNELLLTLHSSLSEYDLYLAGHTDIAKFCVVKVSLNLLERNHEVSCPELFMTTSSAEIISSTLTENGFFQFARLNNQGPDKKEFPSIGIFIQE